MHNVLQDIPTIIYLKSEASFSSTCSPRSTHLIIYTRSLHTYENVLSLLWILKYHCICYVPSFLFIKILFNNGEWKLHGCSRTTTSDSQSINNDTWFNSTLIYKLLSKCRMASGFLTLFILDQTFLIIVLLEIGTTLR
mgnify:CR=1 FL=1